MKKHILLIIVILGIIFCLILTCKHFIVQEPEILLPKFVLSEKTLGSLALKDNYLYAEEFRKHSVQIFQIDPNGGLLHKSSFGKSGNAVGEFGESISLAIKDNFLFVGDAMNNRIQVFLINADGALSFHSVFGHKGQKIGEFNSVAELNLTVKDDYLFVADWGNSRIQVLQINPDGALLPKFVFGNKGHRLGEFAPISNEILGDFPPPFSLSAKGRYLFVTDPGNNRIQVFQIDPEGRLSPKFAFGRSGSRLGRFNMPFHLSVKDDFLFVADLGNYRIQVLQINPNGTLSPKAAFGTKGSGFGEFESLLTMLPVGGKYLYVSDTRNHRIQVLEIKY